MHNKRIITLSKIGYNAPLQANWAYGIWKVDFLDLEKSRNWQPSVICKENFGGDSRFKRSVQEKTGFDIIETTGVYTKTGTPKITGIQSMNRLDSEEFIKKVVDFLLFNDLK